MNSRTAYCLSKATFYVGLTLTLLAPLASLYAAHQAYHLSYGKKATRGNSSLSFAYMLISASLVLVFLVGVTMVRSARSALLMLTMTQTQVSECE